MFLIYHVIGCQVHDIHHFESPCANSIVVFWESCSFLFQFLLYPLCPWSSNESFYFCIVPLLLWLSLHSHALDIAYPIAVVFCIGFFRCFSYSFNVFSCFIHDFVCSTTIVCYEKLLRVCEMLDLLCKGLLPPTQLLWLKRYLEA